MSDQSEIPFAAALDECRTAIAIADAQSSDQPLVYVNRAFEELFGYRAADVIGRNCRFLQGTEHDQPGLDVVRRAVACGESCSVVIRNYKKDGSVLLNELSIGPVHGDRGRVTHFVGSQAEVPHDSLHWLRDDALFLLKSLTHREREVLSQLLEGASNKAVARHLDISVRTVETHRLHLLRKMGVRNVTQLVPFAIAAGAYPGLPQAGQGPDGLRQS